MVDAIMTPKFSTFMSTMKARKGLQSYLGTDREMALLYPSMMAEDYVAV